MKKTAYIRFSLTLFILFAMLSPTAILAAGDDGKKHFKQGIKYEVSDEWDKAVEEFALAITENPKNPEYRLHYRRSLFNASQMYMKRGNKLAEENDFAGAYLAFRKAYAYDPVNELAKSEMERMLRLQKGLQNGDVEINEDGTVKLIKTSLKSSTPDDDLVIPQKLEKLRDVPFPGGIDLKFLIKELAKDLDLNVLFENLSFRADRKIEIELKNVTAAKALDYIFLQENLFFQKVGPRTILVADQNQRQRFQQLVLRTFYLANASPKDIANVIKTAIPAQPGRTPTTVLTDDATNSITVRDTSENIQLIGNLIDSLDKDRAEVVMDVAIYEVSNSDLLQLGNQIGGTDPVSFGGTTRGVVGLGGNDNFGGTAGTAAGNIIPRAFGVGLVIPAVNLIAFQSKTNTKLIASTQIHAFNNEESSARIGQRVPVQTAQLLGYGNQPGNQGTGGTIINNNQAASVVNYEPTGLDLKFKPIVFPNQDVQVEMNIESKDVAEGGTVSNPIFTERTIKGTARIQNNKTLLLASVAQNNQTEGRAGLPLLGLIPIIGRLFTAPTKNNRQTDIVIAITPRVIRAPAILPEDEVERETGSLAVPTSGSLEAMIVRDERDEQIAAARRLGNKKVVQLPDREIEEPAYVKSNEAQTNAVSENQPNNNKRKTENQIEKTVVSEQVTAETPTKTATPTIPDAAINLRPIDTGVKTLQIAPTGDSSETTVKTKRTSLEIKPEPQAEIVQPELPTSVLEFLPALPMMKKGERTKIAVMVKSAETFRSAVLGLQFDNAQIAVRNVEFGDVFGADLARTQATPFLNQGGKCFVSLSSPKDTAQNSSGILAYIEIEALTDGQHQISFNKDVLNMLTADGRNFSLKY